MPGCPTKATTAFAIRWMSSAERSEGSWTRAVELSGEVVGGVGSITQLMYTHTKEQLNKATVPGHQGGQLVIILRLDLNLYMCIVNWWNNPAALPQHVIQKTLVKILTPIADGYI